MKTVNEFKGYFMMPWDIAVESTKSEILIYGYLFSMNNGTEWIELSYSQIMEAVGISKRKIVSDALSKFESKGYITIERNNQSRNRIKFNNVIEISSNQKGTKGSYQKGTTSSNQKGTKGSYQKGTHIKEHGIKEHNINNNNNNNNTIEPSIKEPCKGVGVFNFEGDNEVEVSSIFKSSRSALKEMADRASSFSIKNRFEKIPSVEDITGDLSWMSNRKAKEDRMHDAQIIRTRLMKQVV